jgi:hypothetical protein
VNARGARPDPRPHAPARNPDPDTGHQLYRKTHRLASLALIPSGRLTPCRDLPFHQPLPDCPLDLRDCHRGVVSPRASTHRRPRVHKPPRLASPRLAASCGCATQHQTRTEVEPGKPSNLPPQTNSSWSSTCPPASRPPARSAKLRREPAPAPRRPDSGPPLAGSAKPKCRFPILTRVSCHAADVRGERGRSGAAEARPVDALSGQAVRCSVAYALSRSSASL